jgi:hypothetical protein
MAVISRHFLGFNPSASSACKHNCARNHQAATVVWWEAWFDTFSTRGAYFDTGIWWSIGVACFDLTGCFLGTDQCPELPTVGFHGSTDNMFGATPPTADQWLAQARKATNRDSYPEPGTVQVCPSFIPIIGKRHPSAFNFTPGR